MVAPNPLKGVLITAFVASGGVIMVWLLFRPYGLNFLDEWQTTFDGKDDLGSADVLLKNRSGRSGLAFITLGLLFIWEGCKAFIPILKSDSENLDEDEEEEMFDDLEDDDEEEEVAEVDDEDELLPEEMKRSHVLVAAAMEIGFLLLIVEFSYSTLFGTQIWVCLLALKVIQMSFEQILSGYLKDILLLCPLMVGLEVVQFAATMGANGFIDFLLSYFVGLMLLLAERLYLDPALKASFGIIPHISVFIQRRYIELRQKVLDPDGLEPMEEIPDVEEPEENVIEELIDAFQVYSNEATATVVAPFVVMWMLMFSKELQLVQTYGIRDSDMVYYILFTIISVPTQMIMDCYVLNCQELFHGWKVRTRVLSFYSPINLTLTNCL